MDTQRNTDDTRNGSGSSIDSLTQPTLEESEEIENLYGQVEDTGDLADETNTNDDFQFESPAGDEETDPSESYIVHDWEWDQENEDSDEYNSIDEQWNEEVTAEDVYDRGIDMQGIPWDTLPISRWDKRLSRLHTYENYENLRASHEGIEQELIPLPRTDGDFYRFKYTRLTEKCSFVHFQLRHLLSASSKNDVFYTRGNYVKHWDPNKRSSRVIMDLSGFDDEAFPSRISTLAAKDGIVIVGGFNGEYAVINTDSYPRFHISRFTHAINGIINHIHISHPRSSSATTSPRAFASSNDQYLRTLDLRNFQIIQSMRFEWPVNCSAISPDRRLLAVVGDDTTGLLVDADGRGGAVAKLKGHLDYGFSCAWSVDGMIVATGNQDKTCMLYDIRNWSKPVKVLGASMGAVRSLTFSDDGKFLAMAEPADFVHVFDVASDFSRSQVVDFFGEICGVSFSPDDGELLYIGNSDPAYGSVLEFERTRPILYASNLCI